VREEAKEATRERIIDALVRVVLDEGVHAFSVATVAARAGISHRTVYRHFASREELLEGLSEVIETSGPPASADARTLKAVLDRPRELAIGLFHELHKVRDRATAEFIIGVALRHNTRGRLQRWALAQAETRARFPNLTPEEQLAGAATVRALVSSNVWFHLCVQLDVPVEVAAQGLARALELVLEDLAQRNQASARLASRRAEPRKRATR
jgi:AcrR family transcriptional regulator